MRLGELKVNVEAALNGEGYLQVEVTPLYNEQAFLINNADALGEAIKSLNTFNITADNYAQISSMLSVNNHILSTDEYNQLRTYVNTLNPKIPILSSILKTLAPPENPQTISIKLPNDISSFEQLSELNNEFTDIFKLLHSIHTEKVRFKGFDIGSEWYQVIIDGIDAFVDLAGCIEIALKVYNFGKTLSDKDAKKQYKASLKKGEEVQETGLNSWKERRIEEEIEEGVEELVADTDIENGRTESEKIINLTKLVTALVKQLGDGVEFHMSLNPPDFINTKSVTSFSINYEKVRQSLPKKEVVKQKSLDSGKGKDTKQ